MLQDVKCIQELLEHLLAQCKLYSASTYEHFSELLLDNKKPVGLVINEKFLNLPIQLGPLFLQSLM